MHISGVTIRVDLTPWFLVTAESRASVIAMSDKVSVDEDEDDSFKESIRRLRGRRGRLSPDSLS